MSYIKCLELAGLNIIDSKYFGEYQDDWYGTYIDNENNLKFIHGPYGNDITESDNDMIHDYCYHKHYGDKYYNPFYDGFINNCKQCNNIKIQAIEFANKYINDSLTPIEALNLAKQNLKRVHDVEEMVNWIHEQIEKFSNTKDKENTYG